MCQRLRLTSHGNSLTRLGTKNVKSTLYQLRRLRQDGRSLFYYYREYFELVDWIGRAVKTDKRGAIDTQLPPILTRLGIDRAHWCKATQLSST